MIPVKVLGGCRNKARGSAYCPKLCFSIRRSTCSAAAERKFLKKCAYTVTVQPEGKLLTDAAQERNGS